MKCNDDSKGQKNKYGVERFLTAMGVFGSKVD